MRRRKDARAEGDLLAGTLDMLILRMLQAGPAHGLQIAQDIERRSDDVLLVQQGSLYPALHRLEERGWISSSWGVSDTNRRARFYSANDKWHRHVFQRCEFWQQMVKLIDESERAVA